MKTCSNCISRSDITRRFDADGKPTETDYFVCERITAFDSTCHTGRRPQGPHIDSEFYAEVLVVKDFSCSLWEEDLEPDS